MAASRSALFRRSGAGDTDGEQLVTHKTLRRRYFNLPGRLTRTARTPTLHLPTRWPWREQFDTMLTNLRAVVLVT